MKRALVTVLLLLTASAQAQQTFTCQDCAEWNVTQEPFRVYGNTYYVGVRGLSSILITSDQGHVLIDGGLPESAPKIAAGIRALGFRIEDVELIVNSHAHFDHAGGIAELQRLSGAKVAATDWSARALRDGRSGPEDPQHGALAPFPAVANVGVLKAGETLRVGSIAVTAHSTGGHTPGGTSWTWQSCERRRCLNMVYADSLTPISAEGFKFTGSREYPGALADFEKAFATVEALSCDILLTPHPDATNLWARLKRRTSGESADALIDAAACRHYVASARQRLAARVTDEKK
jgi:metallo-beta-lactamase class B